MEYDIIFTDEMDHFSLRILPPSLPTIRQQLLRIRDITDRSVEPYIQHLSFRPFHGNRDTPIQIATHRTGLQTHIQPTLTLPVDVRLPFFMILQDPSTQERLPLIQRQIPMFRLTHHRLAATDSGFRIDQIRRAKRRTASLALIAICLLVSTMRTSTRDIAVGQELLRLLIVVLLACFLDEFAFIIQCTEKIRGHLMMRSGSSTRIDIKRDTELLERFLDNTVVTIHHILRRDPLFLRSQRDGYPMLVRTTNHQHFLPLQTKVTGINISRHIHPGQVSDMHRSVRIRQRRSNQRSLKMFFHTLCSLFEGQRYGIIWFIEKEWFFAKR